jgi:hypothetical protein
MNQPKHKLKINMSDLEIAFEHHDTYPEIYYFLDLETGEVEMTTGEVNSVLDEVHEEYADPESGEVDWVTALSELNVPDWQQEILKVADQVEAGFGTRYIRIPQEESYEGYDDMVWFIETVSNPHLKARLERAIRGRGAFRYFKDVLYDFPNERERWFRFQNDRKHQRILDWLEVKGIEPIFEE